MTSELMTVFTLNRLYSPLYNALFLSHMTYGLLLWGNHVEQISKLQKKSVRLITGSEYLAHSEPLFKELELLKIEDLYKLRILKFYYNISYGLSPSYFNCYIDVLNVNKPCGYELRQSTRPKIRLPRTRLIFTESCLLYQLIKLINFTQTNNSEILEKKIMKRHTYFGFNFNVTRIYLSTYTYECTMPNCFKCRIFRYSAIIIIVLKLNPYRTEKQFRNHLNNAL